MGILRPGKPLASLSSGLLARKGQARPAMRPQGFASMAGSPAPQGERLEDLGWNDMGQNDGGQSGGGQSDGPSDEAGQPVAVPPVLVVRDALARDLAAVPAGESEPRPAPAPDISLATATRIGRESAGQTSKGKVAFTLRLDGERHLRLRLASAVAHRSAQALVVQALDHFLTTMPEVDVLLAQLPEPSRHPTLKVSR